ncbi:MAG: helicase [Chitinivibrionales bacterium]|nr:helicase [Chitinivibrionales bacterium]
MDRDKPLIVQSDGVLLLEVDSPQYRDARDAIGVFSHLEKSPEHIHSYVVTPLSLWNAASLGLTTDEILARLEQHSRYPLPANIVSDIRELMGRFGAFRLERDDSGLVLHCDSESAYVRVMRHAGVRSLLGDPVGERSIATPEGNRGLLKQALMGLGFPVDDRAGYVDGEPYAFNLRSQRRNGKPFEVREYQHMAAESFFGSEAMPGGSGVVVLPCGAGKTVVGIAVMSMMQTQTLILATNVTAARQWRQELLDKTDIPPEDIGEYSGESKEIRPITIATYQILTYRQRKDGPFVHFGLFDSQNWGLIVYDEVHLLPAPVFKATAQLQARRRLGLTATLVREDGLEGDVFALIGPKKLDIPWKDLERQGWIATARCVEVRVDLPAKQKLHYLGLSPKEQVRAAYENPSKIPVVKELVQRHRGDRILVIGLYLSQLHEFARQLDAELITGSTPNRKREELYDSFRRGDTTVLILSKVGNFAVDLPDANVAIQVSGSFGSRQEEAQRLGRILRPKAENDQATFYSVVTRESKELDFAMKRQLFLAEQGYTYEITYWNGSGPSNG